ncbi:Adenylate cyclase, class 3 [Enhydrobacter aerosaccus]|uniref:Adenylate cyclase, class 3 n=1 Tax=Enhydrobacter aerosaccus TaxID=225324 RepID=A0A1T4K2H9_9HYPH|nr:adenylate/guanylate cyclase domain-containing protein [Enhydrobacter aerosaccus]SJZ36477.1 Adenylate cyclase, class 3 [Enhydrobacter aerosaccus]
MSLATRKRRSWRIFLWLSVGSALVSAYFGYSVGDQDTPWHSAWAGVVNSILIATPILLFEIEGRRFGLVKRLLRLPLLWYFVLRILFYVVVIVTGLVLARVIASTNGFKLDDIFRNSVVFAIAMSVSANIVFEFGGLVGFATLRNLLTGRYVKPRTEHRVFLLVDMKNSTGIAEKLGSIAFHQFLNEFFRNVSDAALDCRAEIHKYVGDEAILTWSKTRALANGECLACPFLIRERITADREVYLERFGLMPEFRAAIHYGEIVAGEIGDVRREIAFVGDTLNVAARLLDACRALGHDVLVSADTLAHTSAPDGVTVQTLPMISVRGRSAPLAIAALSQA